MHSLHGQTCLQLMWLLLLGRGGCYVPRLVKPQFELILLFCIGGQLPASHTRKPRVTHTHTHPARHTHTHRAHTHTPCTHTHTHTSRHTHTHRAHTHTHTSGCRLERREFNCPPRPPKSSLSPEFVLPPKTGREGDGKGTGGGRKDD
eukprot:9466911-Pyramimonas_sp.AAC.1